jgi:hypothetical protein
MCESTELGWFDTGELRSEMPS